jgi:hypothetical protein
MTAQIHRFGAARVVAIAVRSRGRLLAAGIVLAAGLLAGVGVTCRRAGSGGTAV